MSNSHIDAARLIARASLRRMKVHVEDSEAMANARRRELEIPVPEARRLAQETLEILRRGHYRAPSGARVDIAAQQARAASLTRFFDSHDPLPAAPPPAGVPAVVRIANVTTAAAAAALVGAGERTMALNFANGVSPGGGFLMGARAQEEALCRQSGLFPTLESSPFYAVHRARSDAASSDAAIVSPGVPFFRDDDGALREQPFSLDVITCAAPVAKRVGTEHAAALMAQRIPRVLAIGQALGVRALVLGAWGCGAFGNNAAQTARTFHDALAGPFAGVFAHVTFAITDWSPERRFLGPFRDAFA